MVYLLDANVLIALTVAEHEHHSRVAAWLSTVDRVALCPVVEGSLVRFLVRIGESVDAAGEVLRSLRSNPRCEFWPDDLSYADADLGHVRGHRQVTDAYLAALAAARDGALLVTLDAGLARDCPTSTLLVPQQ
ncbi:PIN domain-containing protein [Nakamurella silvestris]|nr:PIN domain-containing protein [Nakamurella silvestris]